MGYRVWVKALDDYIDEDDLCSVACLHCGRPAGKQCMTPTFYPAKPHAKRVAAYIEAKRSA